MAFRTERGPGSQTPRRARTKTDDTTAANAPRTPSIWTNVHPRLLALVRSHRSTLIFANNRRLAERLAGSINELAGETLVRAHHGSLARAQRAEIEELLKAGQLRGLVATSSLELGIDMGAIDLVVQIEAPPSVASALQRVGRAGHRIDEVSTGIVIPKFRSDLVACAAVTHAVAHGDVEPSRYPRNPLDVLAQQIVAAVSMDDWRVDDLFALVRRAAPYAELARGSFDGVLDMLAGRYPSDEFAELRPRVTWDRTAGVLTARQGARQVAIANAGTIPDRGLYGVFLAGAPPDRARVGELDEEMVFESHPGDTFVLGASTWRIEEMTHDRVLVSPAPGEPGQMPFWRGEAVGRPIELGMAIGRLVRELGDEPAARAAARLERDHGLEPAAAGNLLQYLKDQAQAVDAVPDDRTLVVERCPDDLGDWRICVLSPLGGRVHAPWAMAVTARIRDERGLDVETMWTDEGFVVRFPEGNQPPDPDLFIPDPDEVERLVLRQLGSTALFAARFREAAGRALLLPRRRPGARRPLWQQRKRAADLLAIAAPFGSFPIILETYRECLRDIFDLPALVDVLRRIRSRSIEVKPVETETPSPFAASLLFGYVANYIYDGDAPLAERRAQALSIDPSQLKELIGDTELRELLDAGEIERTEAELQHLPARWHARSNDAVHDLLLRIGDLSSAEIAARCETGVAAAAVAALVANRRAVRLRVGGDDRLAAVEDAARYRDAIGAALPPGLPAALLEPPGDPLADLVRRYARTHGPFRSDDVAGRFGIATAAAETVLTRLAAAGRVLAGEFRPGGRGREWCDREVLATIRQRSLARLRKDVAPVDSAALGRFLLAWHGVGRPRGGLDALLDTVEQLQGMPLAASALEREILPARAAHYQPADLDALIAAGEVAWLGVEPLGERDGRVALYLTDHLPRLAPPAEGLGGLDRREAAIVQHLSAQGASFFASLHDAAGGGFPLETVQALWSLVWKSLVTNDTLQPLRAFTTPPDHGRRAAVRSGFRSRRLVPPTAEGRWSLVGVVHRPSPTEWAASMASQLLTRHGIVTRDVATVESLPGGFGLVYQVLRRLEETGRIRRGYFVAGLGGAQFAQPAAVDLLRSKSEDTGEPMAVMLAATDPANPYGALVPWPAWPGGGRRGASRSAGARVVLINGWPAAWIAKGDRQMLVLLTESEPDRSRTGRALAAAMVAAARRMPEGQQGWLIEGINGAPASSTAESSYLIEAGFAATGLGLQLRVPRRKAESDGVR
jgi:ATP-dependent Lhr-like helicase